MSCRNNSEIEEVIYYSSFLTVFSSCLTIFGSCLIILTFILWKDIRRSVARVILLFLALADLGTGLGYLVSSTGYIVIHLMNRTSDDNSIDIATVYSGFCAGTSFLNTLFPVCSFFWTGSLAIYFVVALVFRKSQWSRTLLIIFNLCSWTIPLVICSVALYYGVLGGSASRATAGWCFVALDDTQHNYSYTMYLLLEAACGKGWEFLFYAVVIVCYTVIFCNNRRIKKHSSWLLQGANPPLQSESKDGSDYVRISLTASNQVLAQAITKIDWKLLLIPVVFIILRAPGTYRYLLSMSTSCHPNYMNCTETVSTTCFNFGGNYYILFLQALFDPLQGFGNSILFVFLSKVILRRLMQLFCCCRFSCKRKSLLWQQNEDNFRPSKIETKRFVQKVRYSPSIGKQTADDEIRLTDEEGFESQLDNESLESSLSGSHNQYGSIEKTTSINNINN